MDAERPDFDLLTDEWIPVVELDGTRRELSLLSCLERAHELREIVDPSPLVVFGLHRFLGAVVQSYLRIADEDEWAEHWDRGRFGADFLAEARRRCAGRLRLFDPQRPFYQSGDIPLQRKPQEPLKTVGYLFPEDPTGDNLTHFTHKGEEDHVYCPVCCAKGLLIQGPFAYGAGSGFRASLSGPPPLYVLPSANNLYRTLLLNYLVPGFQFKSPGYADPGPLWEGSGIVGAKEERNEVGFIESLTWQSRRIRLFPSKGQSCSRCGRTMQQAVRKMVYAQGCWHDRGSSIWRDPWVAHILTRKKKGGQVVRSALRLSGSKDTWRDFPRLFLSRRGAVGTTSRQVDWERPIVLDQLDNLLSEGLLAPDLALRYETFALRSDPQSTARIFEWRQDLFDFPSALLPDGEATVAVERAIDLADAVDRYLGPAIKKLHPTAKRNNPDRQAATAAMRGLIRQTSRNYWQRLELPFRAMVADPRLQGGSEKQREWLLEWWPRVRECATKSFEEVVETFDADADELRNQVDARGRFYGGLKRVMQKELNLEVMDDSR